MTAPTSNEPDPLLECSGISEAELASVLDLVSGTDVVELDLTVGSSRVLLRRPPHVVSRPVASASETPAPENASMAIASPLVGVFHPSVRVGDAIGHGQVIGAIEALGMPTSVDSPHDGTVESLLVQDGSPVEYGQPLVLLRRDSQA